MIKRTIWSSGEELPVLGLGTWQRFDTDPGSPPAQLLNVLQLLGEKGGALIDSSPMYGRAEEVIGSLTASPGLQHRFFYATKVWTEGREAGIRQMEASFKKMGRRQMDLMQVHNLVDWQVHLETINRWKKEGRIRYSGITHYTDSMHEPLEKAMEAGKVDFVQFNYSIAERHAEKRLLPAAVANGVAVIVNRPFGEGKLFGRVKGRPLPGWVSELGITSWSQFFLKFIISHPAVTCVIPATADPDHLADNLLAAEGPLPDEETRERMAKEMNS
ncbi:MAG TPA: aldo/keto reductase [Flavisolibacter sp.]|nr:aldo/keto reductase [Flavisolibacter sp.]